MSLLETLLQQIHNIKNPPKTNFFTMFSFVWRINIHWNEKGNIGRIEMIISLIGKNK